MDVKGQGALEYLLLIGGAVLVAAIVIALISGMPSTLDADSRTYCASFPSQATCVSSIVGNVSGDATDMCCPRTESGALSATQAAYSQCVFYDTPAAGVCPP